MTLTRTTLYSASDHTGIARAIELDLAAKTIVHEGVQLTLMGGVPRITITASTGFGSAIAAGLDLSRADLRHLAAVATALADRLGEGV